MTILITAGPTREPLDPVRYLTNRSSGKMGYAIADSAAAHQHRVILISGPTDIEIPDGVDYIPVETAAEMYAAVEKYINKADIAIFAAAVADYRPAEYQLQKIKKNDDTLTLQLIKNPDILGSCRERFHFTGTLIGFAAETDNLEANARLKLERKSCDLIIANDVSRADIGFDSDKNELLIVYKDKTELIQKADKSHLAHIILDLATTLHTSS